MLGLQKCELKVLHALSVLALPILACRRYLYGPNSKVCESSTGMHLKKPLIYGHPLSQPEKKDVIFIYTVNTTYHTHQTVVSRIS